MNFKKLMAVGILVAVSFATNARAADTVQGTVNVSGNVPTFFELWVRGVPGDLDLSGYATVNDRLLGILHVKYNNDVVSLTLRSANTTTGKPRLDGTGSDWTGAMSFKVGGGATCKTVGGTAAGAAATIPTGSAVGSSMGGGQDVAHADVEALATKFSSGLEEDCPFTASWTGPSVALPLAGTYSDVITATMVSD